jgi:ubiquinone biosynthesis protein COQ9
MDAIRQKILAQALPQVRTLGWGSVKLDEEAALCFKRGVVDLALFHIQQGDAALAPALGEMKMREKIAQLIWQRLRYDDRALTQKTAQFLTLPFNSALGVKALLGTSAAIWQKTGTGDSGFSYYTKRASLSAIYSQAILFYLSPQGKEDEAVKAFIKKEIDLLLKTMSFFNQKKPA